jgi:hypothetical protein
VGGDAVIHDEPRPPIPQPNARIEFADDFHDLMHSVWRCHNRRLHLSRAWEYRWEPELRRHTLCRVGRHQLVKTWMRQIVEILDDGEYVFGEWSFAFTCHNCGCEPPLTKL